LVVTSCLSEDLKWLNEVESIPPVYHVVGCQSLPKMGLDTSEGCGESHAYLEFVIKHYEELQQIAHTVIFLHGNRTSWHYPVPVDQQVMKLMADTVYVAQNDAGGVYCMFNTVNAVKEWAPSMHMNETYLWERVFNGTDIVLPTEDIHYSCCGTFWVKTKAIRRRPLETYQRVLQNTYAQPRELNDKFICGRVAEASWMLLFAGVTSVPFPSYCAKEKRNEELKSMGRGACVVVACCPFGVRPPPSVAAVCVKNNLADARPPCRRCTACSAQGRKVKRRCCARDRRAGVKIKVFELSRVEWWCGVASATRACRGNGRSACAAACSCCPRALTPAGGVDFVT
jgi:hypothetical protein